MLDCALGNNHRINRQKCLCVKTANFGLQCRNKASPPRISCIFDILPFCSFVTSIIRLSIFCSFDIFAFDVLLQHFGTSIFYVPYFAIRYFAASIFSFRNFAFNILRFDILLSIFSWSMFIPVRTRIFKFSNVSNTQ